MSMQSESPQFRVRERSRKESAADQPQHVKSGQAVWQARLIMLVMINIAQLWVLGATVEAALARRYSVLWPLVISSGICFLISLSIIRWWRPRAGKATSSGYVRTNRHDDEPKNHGI